MPQWMVNCRFERSGDENAPSEQRIVREVEVIRHADPTSRLRVDEAVFGGPLVEPEIRPPQRREQKEPRHDRTQDFQRQRLRTRANAECDDAFSQRDDQYQAMPLDEVTDPKERHPSPRT